MLMQRRTMIIETKNMIIMIMMINIVDPLQVHTPVAFLVLLG